MLSLSGWVAVAMDVAALGLFGAAASIPRGTTQHRSGRDTIQICAVALGMLGSTMHNLAGGSDIFRLSAVAIVLAYIGLRQFLKERRVLGAEPSAEVA